MLKCMAPADREKYNTRYSAPHPDTPDDTHPPMKTDRLERDEQRSFANWILLQRSKGRKLPYTWSATHKASTNKQGQPDFGVGTWRGWVWLEFKRDYSSPISPEQKEFIADCEARGVPCHIVYTAAKAIEWINHYDRLL
jgi:hypothetical protein